MRNNAMKSVTYERQISSATERMARILGASFQLNDRVFRSADAARQPHPEGSEAA